MLATPERIAPAVRALLADRRNDLVVSSASAYEIAIKTRLGRLSQGSALLGSWDRRMADIGATALPLTGDHALLAGELRWEHRDPFDRLLVAQAMTENLTLVTVDATILGLPGLRTLTW